SESGETTTLKKEGGNWQITAPVATKADEPTVSGITNFVGPLTLSRVIDEKPTDLKDYGLATPRIEVNFKATGDNATHKLFVGDKSPTGGDLFARKDDSNRVFLISTAGEATLNKTTFDLRDKSVVKIDDDKVDGFEIVADGKTIQLAKNGMDWMFKQPW